MRVGKSPPPFGPHPIGAVIFDAQRMAGIAADDRASLPPSLDGPNGGSGDEVHRPPPRPHHSVETLYLSDTAGLRAVPTTTPPDPQADNDGEYHEHSKPMARPMRQSAFQFRSASQSSSLHHCMLCIPASGAGGLISKCGRRILRLVDPVRQLGRRPTPPQGNRQQQEKHSGRGKPKNHVPSAQSVVARKAGATLRAGGRGASPRCRGVK